MKIFGGGTPQQPKKGTPEPAAHGYAPGAGGARPEHRTAPKPAVPTLTKRQKRNRILIIIIAVTLAIIAMMCAAAAMMMKPPALAGTGKPTSTIRPEQNDATIHDTENGDEMELDHGDAIDDIDMGNRREGVYTVLVCATDIDGTRTDALMVASLDTVNDAVNVINIPRDLMSNCNRSGASKKINAAYGTRGGIETTKSEVKKVLGFTPDKYVVVSFDAIAEIIDALGGVDYEIPWRMKYDDPTQNLHIDFQPGMTHLDGQAAVEFMRWRKNNSGVRTGVSGYTGGDEERIEKDQKFLKFLAKEVFTITNVTRIPSLAQAVFSNVETDLTAGEVLWLAWQLYDVKNENINMMTLPGYGTMSYAGTGTMYSFYFPYRSQTLEMVNEFINPYEKAITNIDIVSGPTTGGGKRSSGSSKPKKQPEEEPEETDEEDREDGETENPDDSGSNSTGGGSGSEGTGSGSTGIVFDPEGTGSGSGSNGSGPDDTKSGSNSAGTGSGSDGTGTGDGGASGSDAPAIPTESTEPGAAAEPVSEPGNDLSGFFAPGVEPEPPATVESAPAE